MSYHMMELYVTTCSIMYVMTIAVFLLHGRTAATKHITVSLKLKSKRACDNFDYALSTGLGLLIMSYPGIITNKEQ